MDKNACEKKNVLKMAVILFQSQRVNKPLAWFALCELHFVGTKVKYIQEMRYTQCTGIRNSI